MKLALGVAALTLALGAQANTITYTFQENGVGNLGHTSTFTESGISLTVTASPGQDLYAKNQGGDETGLGIAAEEDHEIDGNSFIQITVPTAPGSNLKTITLGSVQPGELARIFFSTTLGTLGTLQGVLTSDNPFDISSFGPGYIGIAGGGTGGADVLLDTLTAEVITVPDGSSTVTLLGIGLTGVALIRRRVIA
jgi:hypothetical protein